jgi:hypothetical protein
MKDREIVINKTLECRTQPDIKYQDYKVQGLQNEKKTTHACRFFNIYLFKFS